MRLKKQKFASDCGLACVSMILGKSYANLHVPEKMYKEILSRGSFSSELIEILEINGLKRGKDFQHCYTSHVDAGVLKVLLWNRTAMLSVDSLNNDCGKHMIILHGNKIFDPSPHRTYKWLSSVYPTEVIIFKDQT